MSINIIKKSRKFLAVFFSLLILFNITAPAVGFYFLNKQSRVYAQSENTNSEDTGIESVSGGISCYDTGKKESGLWDKITNVATNPASLLLGGPTSAGIAGVSWFAKKAGGIVNFVKNPLKWFVCGVSGMLASAIDFLNMMVGRLMLFDPTKSQSEAEQAYRDDCATSSTNDPGCTSFTGLGNTGKNNLKQIWRSLLNVANVFLVIAFLIMVISSALDLGVFNAYTIKKVLPKIIIAAIAANLSWIICSVVITGVNYVGIGIQSVMISPFTGDVATGLDKAGEAVTDEAIGEGGAAFTGPILGGIGAIVVAIFASGGAILLPLLAFVLVAMIIAFVLFLVRRILLIMLVILAPLAFMAWALPGGEQLFKKWWKTFTQLLLVYPYAMVLLGSGIVVANVIGQTAPATDGAIGDVINAFLMIIALVLPYILLPTAFKLIGGTLGTITGKFNDRSKGLIDRARNKRDESNWALQRKAAKDRRLSLRSDREAGVGLERMRNQPGIRGRWGRRGLSQQDLDILGTDLQKHSARRQAAVLEGWKYQQDARKLDISSSQHDVQGNTTHVLDENGNTIRTLASHDRDGVLMALARGQRLQVRDSNGNDIHDDNGRNVGLMDATNPDNGMADAAMYKLAEMGRTAQIRELRNTNNPDNAHVSQAHLQSAVRDNAGSLIEKAPDLIKPAGPAFYSTNAEAMSKMSADTVEVMVNHVMTNGSQQQQQAMLNEVYRLTQNDKLLDATNTETARAFHDQLSQRNLMGGAMQTKLRNKIGQ